MGRNTSNADFSDQSPQSGIQRAQQINTSSDYWLFLYVCINVGSMLMSQHSKQRAVGATIRCRILLKGLTKTHDLLGVGTIPGQAPCCHAGSCKRYTTVYHSARRHKLPLHVHNTPGCKIARLQMTQFWIVTMHDIVAMISYLNLVICPTQFVFKLNTSVAPLSNAVFLFDFKCSLGVCPDLPNSVI